MLPGKHLGGDLMFLRHSGPGYGHCNRSPWLSSQCGSERGQQGSSKCVFQVQLITGLYV